MWCWLFWFSPHLLFLSRSAEVANSLFVRKRAPLSTSVAIVSTPVKRKFPSTSALVSTVAKRTKHSSQQPGNRVSSLSHVSRFMTLQGTIETLMQFANELTKVISISLLKKNGLTRLKTWLCWIEGIPNPNGDWRIFQQMGWLPHQRGNPYSGNNGRDLKGSKIIGKVFLTFLMTLEFISCAVEGAGGVENDHLVLEKG